MNAPRRSMVHSSCIRSIVCLLAATLSLAVLPNVAWAAKVPRSVLKEYFQTGDKPTASQFSALIDSIIHRTEDRDLLGMKAHSDGGGALVTEGTLIGPDSYTQVEGLSDIWAGQSGFLALSFLENSEVHYGYLQLRAGDPGTTDVYPMFVKYFVYEDQPGVPIEATAVPEPSSLVLGIAGFGLLSVARMARSRRAARNR